MSKGNAENREYLWTSAIYFGKNIYKAENVWYTSIVLITYQEQLGYYKKVENRKALTAPFWSRYLFLSKRRNIMKYGIGLDCGIASVGYCVTELDSND